MNLLESAATFSARKKDQETYREGRRQVSPPVSGAVGPPNSRASEGAGLLGKIKVGRPVTARPGPSPGPTQTAPCSTLRLAPGSAVTYTAERYSYGRMGQKETQVRCPPLPGGTGPLDQGGAACLQLLLPTSATPSHGRPSTGVGLSTLLPTKGLCPQPPPACLVPPPVRAQHR